MNAVAPAATAAQSAQAAHVFVTGWRPGPAAAAMTAGIDPGFLAEVGWDPAAPGHVPPGRAPAGYPHGLPGRRLPDHRHQQRGGSASPATVGSPSMRLGDNHISLLPAPPAPLRGPAGCAVTGCAREWVSSRRRCAAATPTCAGAGVADGRFPGPGRTADGAAPCGVAACSRQRRNVDGRLLRRPPATAADRQESRPWFGRRLLAAVRAADRPRWRDQLPWPAAAGHRRGAGRAAAALPGQRRQDQGS